MALINNSFITQEGPLHPEEEDQGGREHKQHPQGRKCRRKCLGVGCLWCKHSPDMHWAWLQQSCTTQGVRSWGQDLHLQDWLQALLPEALCGWGMCVGSLGTPGSQLRGPG
jgi:hypothetical protein